MDQQFIELFDLAPVSVSYRIEFSKLDFWFWLLTYHVSLYKVWDEIDPDFSPEWLDLST